VLLGGETAEMPDTYRPGVVDVAGCMIGWIPGGEPLDGASVRPGDRVLGLAAAGLHTNGFSLARRVVAASGLDYADPLPGGGGESLGAALLTPHRWYGPAVWPLLGDGTLRALAHVTGGGIEGNLVRVLPAGCRARIAANAWPPPPLFRWLLEAGGVPLEDARQALNLGIGMIAVCAAPEAARTLAALRAAGETAFELGEIASGEPGVEWT
jgi:phosphoribosylformylglycinamidine cyclo-ligase